MWIIIAALALQGCKLGVDEEDDGEIDTVTISSTDDDSVIVEEEEIYNVTITGSNNTITLRGDISKINIKSGANDQKIIIEEDVLLEDITISSNGNIINVSGGLETVVTELYITGENNLVTLYDVTTPSIVPDKGNDLSLTKP